MPNPNSILPVTYKPAIVDIKKVVPAIIAKPLKINISSKYLINLLASPEFIKKFFISIFTYVNAIIPVLHA